MEEEEAEAGSPQPQGNSGSPQRQWSSGSPQSQQEDADMAKAGGGQAELDEEQDGYAGGSPYVHPQDERQPAASDEPQQYNGGGGDEAMQRDQQGQLEDDADDERQPPELRASMAEDEGGGAATLPEDDDDAAALAAAAEAAAEAAEQHQEQQQRRLNELEAQLRQPDAVMEPGIMDRLRDYVMANGHPQAAVEHLTDSYVGYAQMASLVCRWLEMTQPELPAGGAAGAAAAGPSGGGDGGAGGTPGAAAGGSAAAGPGGAATAGQAQQAARPRLDEAFYLRQLAKERFDPGLFAGVFTSGGSGAPQWLNGLIAEPEGRSLVYELAGRYKNSLLLNFAIHKILMQPGREKEVAAVGGSLTGYFGVFHRLMAAKLREIGAARDERKLAELTRSLKEDACSSQHTYVHAQQVLGELAKHPRGARFRRVAQELEEHASALQGPVVWKMQQWFAEPGQPESHYTVAGLLSDILASSASGAPPTSEIARLFRLYFPPEPAEQPPPLAFLRHPRVFEVLLQGLFIPGRQLQPDTLQAYSGLLALAAAADDQRQFGGGGSGSGDAQDGAGGGSSGNGEQQAAAGSAGGGGGGGGGELDLSAATRKALEAAAELAQRVLQDQKSTPADMEQAATVLDYPCCAAGLLRAMGAQLTRPEYWQTAYHLLKAPPFLTILSLLVPRQPGLHGVLLGLLGRALGALGNANHDIAKGFLSVAVQLVSAGRVFEVLRWAEEWKARADPSLVRHLVFGILEVSAPPYSPDFAGSMLRIMMAAGIRRQRLSTRDWAVKALLDEFAAACAQVQFKPPLSTREAQFLQDISADRPPGY